MIALAVKMQAWPGLSRPYMFYVCMFIYTHTYVYTVIYICMCVCVCIYIYVSLLKVICIDL